MTSFTESPTWRSGHWSFQLRGDEIADIAFEDQPVLRSVRAVVQDRDADTAALVVDRMRDSGSTLTLHVHAEGVGSGLRGVVRVEARGRRLVVLTDLEAERESAADPVGLVVRHPSELSGAALRVIHSDGSAEQSSFPGPATAHHRVLDISALSWRHGGLDVSVAFDGDVFEMEDRRDRPGAPHEVSRRAPATDPASGIAAGDRVRQSVSVEASAVADAEPAAPSR